MRNAVTHRYVRVEKDGHLYLFRWHDEKDVRDMCFYLMGMALNPDCNLTLPECWEIADRMTVDD